ncbi:hypothetical protein GCM10010885_20670 [Alicyclobacillus cellulosilyticus]|uniref:Uncharacterized protein n=1 Tax=Alicyclobacillus cellulosilyticus TaxID=1003997 RepID=A0A917NNL3_9BACL|nr:hypothetical protein [Alicyclobacillus cellulosilyticus]GGJ11237.1 hypothetical protein GCM10010885_20670 [Alicyclobacillus cellulosilyticus]
MTEQHGRNLHPAQPDALGPHLADSEEDILFHRVIELKFDTTLDVTRVCRPKFVPHAL